jgi:hypothetical protein
MTGIREKLRTARRGVDRLWERVLDLGERKGVHAYWAFLAAVAGLCIWTFMTFILSPPRTLLAVNANSESVEVVTFGSQRTGITLAGTAVRRDFEDRGECVSGVITPAPNSKMTLPRQGTGPLTIRIDPSSIDGRAGVFEGAGHIIHTYREPINHTF